MKNNFSLNGISIKYKIFALSGILVVASLMTSSIAMFKMAHLGDEIMAIAETNIPLTNMVTEITIGQLGQAASFEKALRYGLLLNDDVNARHNLQAAVKVFIAHSKTIAMKLAEGGRLAMAAATLAPGIEEQQAFERVAHALSQIATERLPYESQALAVFKLLSSGEVYQLTETSNSMDVQEQKISDGLRSLLAEIGRFSENAALKSEQSEKSAFAILGIIAAIAIVLSILLAYYIINNISCGINYAVEVTERISNGDLTQPINISSGGEIGQQLYALKVMQEHLRGMIREMEQSSTELAASSDELAAVSEQTNKNLYQQQAEVQQVATAMNQMATTIHEVADNAAASSQAAQNANQEAGEGGKVVQGTIRSIEKLASGVEKAGSVIQQLATDSENIGSVLDVIKGVAEQTNLLALNAAIEAARAGEQGRGFAVVADEVRTLAQRTQQSTHEIEQMIEKLQSGTQNAVSVMVASQELARYSVDEAARAGASLEVITAAVESISDMNIQIASAAEEQSSVAEEMNQNITTINSISEQNATASNQTTTSSEELSRMASHLQQLILRFNT
ncbi:MAG: methyl-accepting chemotaxis protein [Gammaproteobacteria bacterium]|nr:methyl-accepting chemotaxis protein [Gammaproteobacteria bacterium]